MCCSCARGRILSVHASTAIEGNQLTLGQVTDVINGKPVLGPPKDIKEVQNAWQAYNEMPGDTNRGGCPCKCPCKRTLKQNPDDDARQSQGDRSEDGACAGRNGQDHQAPPQASP